MGIDTPTFISINSLPYNNYSGMYKFVINQLPNSYFATMSVLFVSTIFIVKFEVNLDLQQ